MCLKNYLLMDSLHGSLAYDGGFCNFCITKQCLRNSTNVSYMTLFLDCSMIKDESNKFFFNCFVIF
jgi:hypothetical protein